MSKVIDMQPKKTHELPEKSKDFAKNEEALRAHFIKQLRVALLEPFSDAMSWQDIYEAIGRLIFTLTQKESDAPNDVSQLKMLAAVHPDDYEEVYKKACHQLGFPQSSLEELLTLVEKGIESERSRVQKTLNSK
jgi:hypothetical protein